MDINFNKSNYVDFADLSNGDVFEHDGHIYMKVRGMEVVDEDGDFVNSIDLESTEQTYLFEEDFVRKLNVELVILD